ncbi:transcriptional regulator BetI [Jannaschia sp. 2305UL9-9]|uniref:transcriptional regulator BetI n=1 Tax=Jannaschia sp. 2305UL9-9 TaxID=3121638 RepID=UPI003527A9A9
MARPDMTEPRRAALVTAAIGEIGAQGSLDVTVGGIARRAGVSTALAHHYFGSKDQILTAAMRHILRELAIEHRRQLIGATTPRGRLAATIRACFGAQGFHRDVVAAWLAFYVSAQKGGAARRLLRVYQGRLRSNLIHDLRPLTPDAPEIADTLAALIDGHYLREALQDGPADAARLIRMIETTTDHLLEGA